MPFPPLPQQFSSRGSGFSAFSLNYVSHLYLLYYREYENMMIDNYNKLVPDPEFDLIILDVNKLGLTCLLFKNEWPNKAILRLIYAGCLITSVIKN